MTVLDAASVAAAEVGGSGEVAARSRSRSFGRREAKRLRRARSGEKSISVTSADLARS
jgi:hypothetical protein